MAYGALGVTGVVLAIVFGHAPLSRPAWLPTQGLEGAVASTVLGLCGAGLALLVTRGLARRASWAVDLHRKLRPFVRDGSDLALAALALASGIGEELFFRGFLWNAWSSKRKPTSPGTWPRPTPTPPRGSRPSLTALAWTSSPGKTGSSRWW